MFDWKKFFKEAKAITILAIFIFALADINLLAKTNDQLLSVSSMEMSGYVGLYNDYYDEIGSNYADELKQIASNLENDQSVRYPKQFYILDKSTGQIISNGDVTDRISEELNSQVNEKMIVIDNFSCKVVDFDHFKLLVMVNTLEAYNEYCDAVASYALASLGTLACAFVLIAIGQKVAGSRDKLRIGIDIAITLLVVATFAGEALTTEMSQLNTVASIEQQALQQDLEYVTNDSPLTWNVGKQTIEAIGSSMANASSTLGSVSYVGDESHIGGLPSENHLDAANDVRISQDESKMSSERASFYIQAALLLLLAFILANETHAREQAAAKAAASGAADLTDNDRRIRTIILLVGIANSCFGIINVLRIRQVVMMNWTDNVSAMISAIFTATTFITIFGSLVSSAILKRCGNVKSYIVVTCGLGVASSIVCGISNNAIVFVVGLLVYNVARTIVRMSDDFYTMTIEDQGRKDRCYVELNGGKSIGQVVGTIAGGIVSVVVSFAFVQIVVGVIYLLTALYALRMDGSEFATSAADDDKRGSMKESLASIVAAARCPSALLYMICIAMMGSVPFMLVQYRLPLDLAALGISTVVLSFIHTLQNVITIYSRSLFHVVSRRFDAVTHAALYVAVSGAIVLLYMMGGESLLIIGLSVALLGLADGAGLVALTKGFRELPELAEMPESDRIMALRLSQKIGDTASSPLLSIFQSGPVLPIIVMALPTLYLLRDKLTRRSHVAE